MYTSSSHQPLVSDSNDLKHELSLSGDSHCTCTALDGNGVRAAAIEFAVLLRGGWTRLVMGNVIGGEVDGRLRLLEAYCQRSGGCL